MRHLSHRGYQSLLGIFSLIFCLLMGLGSTAQAVERVRYFINDASGSPVMVLGPDGSILARYAYAPFGSQVAVQSAARQRLGFVGGLKETPGLHYLKHRYYNPLLGRFYQPDPVGFLAGGATQINRYGYGMNDPYTYRDKNGRQFNQLSDDVLSNLRLSGGDLLSFQWLRQAFTGVISPEDNKQLNNEFLKSYVEGQINFIKSGSFLELLIPGGSVRALGIAKSADDIIDVYRVFGGDARAQGFSWTIKDPRTVSNFRDAAGLPSGGASGATNTANFLIRGRVSVEDIIKSRSALPLDGNKGGFPELIIDPKSVKITNFSVLKP